MLTNSEKYHFADFTRSNYRKIIQLTKSKYSFRTFTESVSSDRFVIWRHDVDYSPQAALKLAQIEAQEGVKSTYFLLPHSEFYNLLEKENYDCFKKIITLGHDIGLHFDSSFYAVENEIQLESKLSLEADFLSKLFEFKINVFSFHNPFAFELSCKNEFYSGLLNTYANKFHTQIGYCSDSNGYWRHDRLENVIVENKYKSLQVLTHPEWWQDEVLSPRERVWRCIDGRSEKLKINYIEFLSKHNRENIDW